MTYLDEMFKEAVSQYPKGKSDIVNPHYMVELDTVTLRKAENEVITMRQLIKSVLEWMANIPVGSNMPYSDCDCNDCNLARAINKYKETNVYKSLVK